MSWSEWYRYSEMKENLAEGFTNGVYQVRATSENRNPIPIQRACTTDPDGILYIGMGYLPGRVGFMINIYKDDAKPNHGFTSVFKEYRLDRIADRRFLEVRWKECDDPSGEERELLRDYKLRTGDIPPGNRRFDAPSPCSNDGAPPVATEEDSINPI